MHANCNHKQMPIVNNGANAEPKLQLIEENHQSSHQEHKPHQTAKVSFIKRFNPFNKTINDNKTDTKHESSNKESTSVRLLKQFWNDQISLKTVKSTENLSKSQKSATLKNHSLSNDSLIDSVPTRAEKSLTLNGRLPLDEFNKFKDANFVRSKKIKLLSSELSCDSRSSVVCNLESTSEQKFPSKSIFPRPESFTLCDNFPQVSATGGKIHWAKREDILVNRKSAPENIMSVKSNKMTSSSANKNDQTLTKKEVQKVSEQKRESISSVGSLHSSNSSNTNSTNRKFSFKTTPSTTASYMNRKIAANSNGTNKVAQMAQRFNQIIQQDATILDEVKKRGAVVVHGSGGCVYKIKEEKVDNKHKKLMDEVSDDSASLISIGKNSTRKKSSLKKRPSIRILVESPRKELKNGNVLSKLQLYETNFVNKETIVLLKPRIPDKSERVLAKTKELKCKKLMKIKETELTNNVVSVEEQLNQVSFHEINEKDFNENSECEIKVDQASDNVTEPELINIETEHTINTAKEDDAKKVKDSKNKYRKIYDKISFRPTFLYGKKANKPEATVQTPEVTKSNNILPTTDESLLKSTNETTITPINDADDELDLQPIDLNLNVYFNNENLSRSSKDLRVEDANNVNSQGPVDDGDGFGDDVTISIDKETTTLTTNQPKLDVKPNESFLFRAQSIGVNKAESAFDLFITDILNENSAQDLTLENNDRDIVARMAENSPSKIDLHSNGIECIDDPDNNYEIISKEVRNEFITSECVDIDGTHTNEIGEECQENIYQSLFEVKGDSASVKSYESFENYDEIAQNILDNKINLSDLLKDDEDDYILSEKPPEPPPPRKNTIPRISSPILISTTSELSIPKRNRNYDTQKSSVVSVSTYEKIKYEQLPAMKGQQQQSVELPLPPRNTASDKQSSDENIYDTIRNVDNRSHISNYEKIRNSIDNIKHESSTNVDDDNYNPYKNSTNDTMSIISNCYESISLKQNYSTINQILRHAISTTTLSSEHRINSIYGTMVGQSLTPPSDRSAGGSDNSDEWIDLSDDEVENNFTDNSFIVICKKTKSHRSPDWSRKVRDHRLKLEEWDDDSDHHYESLYSIQQQRAALEKKLGSDQPLGQQLPHSDFNQSNEANRSIFAGKHRDNDDEYDSFESDNDFLDDGKQPQTGDILNSKLPEPPQTTGQVYALVQRIKNFGSLSKNEISKGFSKIAKKRNSQTKLPPPSRSQFYENAQVVEETVYAPTKFESKSVGKKSRLGKIAKLGRLTINKIPTNFSLNESFEQSEFQNPRNSSNLSKDNENSSSPNLSISMSNFNSPDSDKGLKSKLRKGSAPTFGASSSTSNIYGSLSSKTSTFYVTDTQDVDSGIYQVNDKSTSSPDNSNLNLSSNTTSSVNSDLKRRSIAAINHSRPNDPPPPPPPENAQRGRKFGTTSWYAECGLFKAEDIHNEENSNDDKNEKVSSAASWYTESGLYQTSSNSVASSSGSSGVSTGGECSPCGEENGSHMFLNEPLYQIYSAAKLESISSSEFEPETESDGYEEITKNEVKQEIDKKPTRPTALQLIEPNQGPSRTLWCEVPEVIQSGILGTLSQNEKRLQEAKFEILTSEASYLKSLNLLKSHFMNHPAFRDQQILDANDRKSLFSFIIPVQECADRLLCDLECCWQDNVMLNNLSKNIFKHAEKHFHVYISYCEHQGKLDRTLKRLKESNAIFRENLEALENDPVCCGLNLHSFVMLPMQRITRLPLLIDAVMTKLKSNDDEFDDWKMTLAILNKIVFQCNESANRCEQAFEMEVLSKQIEFPANITPFPLIPFNANPKAVRLARTLVRRGEFVHIIYRGDDAKLTFGKKATAKKNIYCFLFTDIIVLTKKKSDDSFLVFDYCQRSLLQLSSADAIPQLPAKDINTAGKFIMFMTLLENCIKKPIDLILSCPSETERQRWIQATSPPTSENPYETLYEKWDCPQVVIKHAYQSLEPDELTLDVGDVVNVLRKMKDDGWYYGERIRDGAQGWFPGNYTEEVHSAHVRARNLKQRHRLLLYTATYLEAQNNSGSKRK